MNKGERSTELLREYREDRQAAMAEARERREEAEEESWYRYDDYPWDDEGEGFADLDEEEPCPYCGKWACICYDDLYDDWDPHDSDEVTAMMAPQAAASHYEKLWAECGYLQGETCEQ